MSKKQKKALRRILFSGILFLLLTLIPIQGRLRPAAYLLPYAIIGWDVLAKALHNIRNGQIFDENFLMSVATLGAWGCGEYPEAVAVMLFYQVGELFQSIAVARSRRSIATLMDIRPDCANLERDGQVMAVDPEDISIGDTILVRPGERIPLDGTVTEGSSALDTAPLTGEALPRDTAPGDSVLSGCVNLTSPLRIRVTKPFSQSTVSRILELVENSSTKKAQAEHFITKFARYYTPAVVFAALALALIPPLVHMGPFSMWVERALIFLVVSCPCALVISIPLTFFGGIGAASRHGVLVKGSNYLEALNRVETVVFDKTGTLTKGVFKVTEIFPAEGFTEEQLLEYAAKAEFCSNHPIAKSILDAFGQPVDQTHITDDQEISGQGICATIHGHRVLVGNAKLMEAESIHFDPCPKAGTKAYLAVDGAYAGCILIADQVKPDSKEAVAALKGLGIRKTVMLTGDDETIAQAVAEDLALDEYYAQLLPDQKVGKLEHLDSRKRPGSKLAFVGDGINDAPVLARADVGIAMGGLGSDAAIEAADVVLMTDEPSKLVEAIGIARATKRIVIQNIVIALGVKGLFLILGALGIVGMWEAVFGDVGVALIAVFNAMRIIKK